MYLPPDLLGNSNCQSRMGAVRGLRVIVLTITSDLNLSSHLVTFYQSLRGTLGKETAFVGLEVRLPPGKLSHL